MTTITAPRGTQISENVSQFVAKNRLLKLGIVSKENSVPESLHVLVMCVYNKLAAGGCMGGAGVIPQDSSALPKRGLHAGPIHSVSYGQWKGRGRVYAVMAATARAT